MKDNVANVEMLKELSAKELENTLSLINKSSEVRCSNLFLTNKSGNLLAISDRFAVKLKSPSDYAKLENMQMKRILLL